MKRKHLSGSEVKVKFNALRMTISRGGTHDVGRYINKEDDDDFAALINCILHDFIMSPSLLKLMIQQTNIEDESDNQELNLERKVTSSSNESNKAGEVGSTISSDNKSKGGVYYDEFDSLAAYKAIAPNDLARRLPRPRLPDELLRDMYGDDSSENGRSIPRNEPSTLPLADAFGTIAPIILNDNNFQGADGSFSSEPPSEKGPLPFYQTMFNQGIVPRDKMQHTMMPMMMPSSAETPPELRMPVPHHQSPPRMPPLQPPPVGTFEPINQMLEPPPYGPPAPYGLGQTFPAPPIDDEPIAPPAPPSANHR